VDGFESWTDFNVALGAASAALAGLIMVAISVNIKQVLSFPGVSARAAAALSLMVLVLVATLTALIPDQGAHADGVITLIGCGVVWVFAINAMAALIRNARRRGQGTGEPSRRQRVVWLLGNSILFIGPLAALTIGAVMLLLGQEAGAYWVSLGSIGALVASVVFSWVALVEILR
jgi:hypothetical protein